MDADEAFFESVRRIRRSPYWGLFWTVAFVAACAAALRASGLERVLYVVVALGFLLEILVLLQRLRGAGRGA